MRRHLPMFSLALLLFSPVIILAQEDHCPALVEAALEATAGACESLGRNQVCYGNATLNVETFTESDEFIFGQPGDITDLHNVRRLQLSPMDEDTPEWGVAVMRVQANLPDTVPGQNVTFVLFGDVEIENAAEPDSGLNPMQAFYLRSGVGDAACQQAPESGILVQTPEGGRRIQVTINGVSVDLGSTVFIQATPDEAMTLAVLEGSVTVEAFGFRRTAAAGTQVSIPIDEDLSVSGPPGEIEPYSHAVIIVLPVHLLERIIAIIEALTEEEIAIIPQPEAGEPVVIIGAPPDEDDLGSDSFFLPFECATPTILETGSRNYVTQGSYGFDPYNPAQHEMGMSVPELMAAVTHNITMDGQALTPIGDRFLVSAGGWLHIQQMYAIGPLSPGRHVLQLVNSVGGQAVATHSCTYIVED